MDQVVFTSQDIFGKINTVEARFWIVGLYLSSPENEAFYLKKLYYLKRTDIQIYLK